MISSKKAFAKRLHPFIIALMTIGLCLSITATGYTKNNPALLEDRDNFLPLIIAPPEKASVTLVNSTGGTLCFRILGTGIGEMCFATSGPHLYGEFWPGTYDYFAAARCGSISKTRTFLPGESVTIEFYCTRSSLESD